MCQGSFFAFSTFLRGVLYEMIICGFFFGVFSTCIVHADFPRSACFCKFVYTIENHVWFREAFLDCCDSLDRPCMALHRVRI